MSALQSLSEVDLIGQPRRSECPVAPLDWCEFWTRESVAGDFLCEPLLPRGRQVAIYATAKDGKSLLALEIAAALATGREVLAQPAGPRRTVLYFDMEMTEDDLRERLEDLGYGKGDDLSRLRYFLLPALPGLDTPEGGAAMMALVAAHDPELVVIDTFGRAVHGAENDGDTFRGYYRHTGSRLRAECVAVLRLDHAGKDAERGQRGSSSKSEDVDIVWRLTATGSDLKLRATHRRVAWVPEVVALKRHLEPVVCHRLAPTGWPAGTAECAAALDRLDVALDASAATAITALRTTGEARRREVVLAALRHRRTRP